MGNTEVELADDQVDHRDVVARRAVAAGVALGGLDQGVGCSSKPFETRVSCQRTMVSRETRP
jgi:hypothetical protein